ncbi:hypothetical protein M3Y99_01159400 [Aphelenchoides fujianensis]|nr:hypothetical protein M3Y99_01159400 [Aphelenchoides fujianensis]
MSSLEMGFYPFANPEEALMDYSDMEERVPTEWGPVKVSIYGDRSKEAIVTFHDLGLDADNNFQNFFQFGTVVELGEKFCVYNINAPGQEMDAKPLHASYAYPSMDSLAQMVDEVVRHFRLKSFIGFGVGVGANVMLRYATKWQQMLVALILVNADCGTAGWLEWGYEKANVSLLRSKGMNNFTVNYLMWHNFGKHEDQCDPEVTRQYRSFFFNHPNPGNLAMFMEAYLNRTEVVLQQPASGATSALNAPILNVPVLQLVGSRSAFLEPSIVVNTKLNPAKSEWVKVSNACGLVPGREVGGGHRGLGYFAHLNVRKVVDRLHKGKDDSQGNGCAVQTVTEMDSSSF